MVLVSGLGVDERLGGRSLIARTGHSGDLLLVEGAVASLHHVEVEPVSIVEIFAGGQFAHGVKRHQASLAVAGSQARGQSVPDFLIAANRTIAAIDPENVWTVRIPFREPLCVDEGVFGIENLRAIAPHGSDLIAPRRQKADVHTEASGFVDDPINVFPIARWIGAGRVEI